MQPWNRVVFPSPAQWPMTEDRARSIPGVGRALGLIAGMAKQMPLQARQGTEPLPNTMLEQPDPTVSRSWWVGVQVEDYLLHGNAVAVVTSRFADGWPASVAWVPARQVTLEWDYARREPTYRVDGREVSSRDVIHVRRGADPTFPYRGVGVVEQHLGTLGRVSAQERYEQAILDGSAVPSVAVITPNTDLSPAEAEAAKESWLDTFAGPVRSPAILPAGTEVKPLAWSPHDSEMTAARQLSKSDLADIFNLDGYWLGASTSSFTYQSPGPMYVNLIRQTVAPILEDFEGVWTLELVPRGQKVKFDRAPVLRDDMTTEVSTLNAAVKDGLLTWEEAREHMQRSTDAKFKPDPAAKVP